MDDSYVSADDSEDTGGESATTRESPPATPAEGGEGEGFDGKKGAPQPLADRDPWWAVLFFVHFGVVAWWFVDSFLPGVDKSDSNGEYEYVRDGETERLHAGLLMFVTVATLAALSVSFLTVVHMLRHSSSALKTLVASSVSTCLGVAVFGLLMGEFLMGLGGFVGFVIVGIYANAVWACVPFTSINLSVAITAIRANMGLLLAALRVAAAGFVWLVVATIAGVSARRTFGNWTLAYSLLSYYWTRQVLTHVVSVATAGVVGRWLVYGEETRGYGGVLKHTLSLARTHFLGSICFGSLFHGPVRCCRGLGALLSSKGVPLLPRMFDCMAETTQCATGKVNEWAYVYVGLYGYPYTAAAENSALLLRNKGWDGIVEHKLAGNIVFVSEVAIGLLTGFGGLAFGILEYGILRKSGMANPTSDGFIIGFLVGFLFSSIVLSVVTATIHTVIVCLAESPVEFKKNHGDLSKKMENAWKIKAKKIISVF